MATNLEVSVNLASESHFFTGLSGDVATGGLFLATYRGLSIGAMVTLELSLPGLPQPLVVSGTVRWVREHSVEQPRGVGIAFDALTEETEGPIRRFLRSRPPLYYDVEAGHE